MKPTGIGVWTATNILSRSDLIELAARVEDYGYSTLWYPESLSYESFAMASFLLSHSSGLTVASGIANIYARDAVTSAQGHDSLNRLHGGRFVLGLGVSHIPLVEGARGHNYGKPIATMREYLAAMAAANLDPTIKMEDRNIVLAALGPKMLELSRDDTKGALPYCVTPEHTAMAKQILGTEPWLCVEQKICLTTDVAVARGVASAQMQRYMALPNYRNCWLRLGFSEEEITGVGSDRFLDAMVAWGDEAAIRARIEAHQRAGADQVVIQPFKPDGSLGPDWNVLKALAPSG